MRAELYKNFLKAKLHFLVATSSYEEREKIYASCYKFADEAAAFYDKKVPEPPLAAPKRTGGGKQYGV